MREIICRENIIVFLIVSLILILGILTIILSTDFGREEPVSCKQEVVDYVNSYQITSLGEHSQEDLIARQLHSQAFINQKKEDCLK